MTDNVISQSKTTTWTVQAGSDGLWIDVSTPFSDRGKAVETLDFRKSVAQPGVTYRLACDTVVHTRTVDTEE